MDFSGCIYGKVEVKQESAKYMTPRVFRKLRQCLL